MRFVYQHLDWRELANRLAAEGRMDELFRELMLATAGDVERALTWLDQASARFRQQLGFDPEEFKQRLEEQGFITGDQGERKLSKKGEQALRSSALESVFGKLKRGATTRPKVMAAETCGITYQSTMPITWFMRAAARGSSGCSRGPGTTAST